MSEKLSRIRLVSVNGVPVLALRSATGEDIRNWYERAEEKEALEILPLRLTEKPDPNERRTRTYAEIIEARDFEPEDLPMFL